jgi:hypothetical protein
MKSKLPQLALQGIYADSAFLILDAAAAAAYRMAFAPCHRNLSNQSLGNPSNPMPFLSDITSERGKTP